MNHPDRLQPPRPEGIRYLDFDSEKPGRDSLLVARLVAGLNQQEDLSVIGVISEPEGDLYLNNLTSLARRPDITQIVLQRRIILIAPKTPQFTIEELGENSATAREVAAEIIMSEPDDPISGRRTSVINHSECRQAAGNLVLPSMTYREVLGAIAIPSPSVEGAEPEVIAAYLTSQSTQRKPVSQLIRIKTVPSKEYAETILWKMDSISRRHYHTTQHEAAVVNEWLRYQTALDQVAIPLWKKMQTGGTVSIDEVGAWL